MQITRDEIIVSLQAMDKACVRIDDNQFIEAATFIEEAFDQLLTENKMLIERLQRVESIRFQNG